MCCKMQIHCMDISPSGGLGVCSSDNGKMWIWDTSNGETRVSVLRSLISGLVYSTFAENHFILSKVKVETLPIVLHCSIIQGCAISFHKSPVINGPVFHL